MRGSSASGFMARSGTRRHDNTRIKKRKTDTDMKTTNMKTKALLGCALTLGLLAGGLVTPVHAGNKDKQAKLEAKAKISKADAEKIALAKVPNGTVKEAELEKEHGKLIWSFDIATPDSADITEVQVNAKTGKVEAVEKETPADQAKEKQAEAKEKKAQKNKDNDEKN